MSSKPAPKRRNNEKRKEKSRVAAKDRRGREQELFTQLTDAVPVPKEQLEQLDKASVMRLAISYLKVRHLVDQILPTDTNDEKIGAKASELSYLQALDGFVMVLSPAGFVIYISENIAEYLGVSQIELMGQSVFEMSHPCDHEELKEVLRARRATSPTAFLTRLKCTLTAKGRSLHIKSATYKVIQFTGHLMTAKDVLNEQCSESNNNKVEQPSEEGWLVAVGRPIPHPANIEPAIDSNIFLTKHSLDMKFTFADEKMEQMLGYDPKDLIGRSLYDYHYTSDVPALVGNFKSLFSKGQCETGRFRFLAKRGGYAWVQTQATVIKDKQEKPLSVVCLNYLVTGVECKDEVFSTCQLVHADVKKPELKHKNFAKLPDGAIISIIPPKPSEPEEARPRPATSQIFAARTKDMNKGFLTFSSEEPGLTLLKEEPDDLTHLAPTAGDACIPLEDDPFDAFDDFMLGENYCSLLSDDLNGTPTHSFADSPPLLSPRESESSCDRASLPPELSLDTGFDSGLDCGTPGNRSESELDTYGCSERLEKVPMWGALPEDVRLARPTPIQVASPNKDVKKLYGETGVQQSAERSKRARESDARPVMTEVLKRARRGLSPPPDPVPASSVLMNLLIQQQLAARKAIDNFNQQDIPCNIQVILNPPTGPPESRNPLEMPLTLNISDSQTSTPHVSPGKYISPYPSPHDYKLSRNLIPTAMLKGNTDPILTTKVLSPLKMEADQDMELCMNDSFNQWMDVDLLQQASGMLNYDI